MRSSSHDSININIRTTSNATPMLMLASFCTPDSNNNNDDIKPQYAPPTPADITRRTDHQQHP